MTKEEKQEILNHITESKYLMQKFILCGNWQDLADGVATLTNGMERILVAQELTEGKIGEGS